MEVVGVVADMKQSFEAGAKAEMFVPYLQHPDPILAGMYRNTALVVRTRRSRRRSPARCEPRCARSTRTSRSSTCAPWRQSLSTTVAQPRLQMVLLTLFAAVAALLAVVGVYGVMAYTVSQRTQEIGVRVAMGASPGAVVRMIVGQGFALAVTGVGLGLIAALAVSRVMQGLLFDVESADPLTFMAAPLLLLIAALTACYLPARKAARISPITALGR